MENRREYLVEENSNFKKFNFVDTDKFQKKYIENSIEEFESLLASTSEIG